MPVFIGMPLLPEPLSVLANLACQTGHDRDWELGEQEGLHAVHEASTKEAAPPFLPGSASDFLKSACIQFDW